MKALLLLAALCMLPMAARAQPDFSIKATGSSTARKVADRAAEVLNVRDFGAKCDGVTDDLAAFTAVLNAATGKAGSVIYIPPSPTPCMLSAHAGLPSNTTLWAWPGTATLKARAGNADAGELLLNISSRSNVTVHGVTFDGGGFNFTNGAPAVVVNASSNVTFEQVTVQNVRGRGIYMSNVNQAFVRRSSFVNVGNYWNRYAEPLNTFPVAATATDRWSALIYDNTTLGGTWGHDIGAIDNYFSNIGLDPIEVDTVVGGVIANNIMQLENNERTKLSATNWPGVLVTNATQMVISSNVIIGAQGNCIDVAGMLDSVIAGNTLQGCHQAGISVSDGSAYGYAGTPPTGNVISNNSIRNVLTWPPSVHRGAITFMGAIGNNTVVGNIIDGSDYGVWINPAATVTGTVWIDQSNIGANLVSGMVGGLATIASPLMLSPVPPTAATACVQGQIALSAGYIYGCTATNTWARGAIAGW